MIKKILLILVVSATFINVSKADEGMWLPMFVERLNYVDMQKMGLQLTPEEIYSVNNSSLKDAIVGLGQPGWNFCTGEVISKEGLFLTNHHCGYGTIQENSTEEHNYLEDGFWAMSRDQEIPAGFSVSILDRMDDVTSVILEGLTDEMSLEERNAVIKPRLDSLKKLNSIEGTKEAVIKSFYKGNEYYMFVYNIYQDVRLVGAPPSAIGKFGGDTDNWMWPRHTGDFTMFRIYTDKDNNSAPYSEKNIPFKPKHHLPISLDGVDQGDYAMIFGFPGSTDRYLTSYGVKLAIEKDQPSRVKIRRQKLDLYEEGMNQSEAIRIQYASKHARVSNYWKYFIGQTKGLKKLKVYDKKKAEEDAFVAWYSEDKERKTKYKDVLKGYEDAYAILNKVQLVQTYLGEAIFGVEAINLARSFYSLQMTLSNEESTQDQIDQTLSALREKADAFYKDYQKPIDQKVFSAMMKVYYEDIDKSQQPESFKEMVAKYKSDFDAMAEKVYTKSIFPNQDMLNAFLDAPSAKKLAKDPILKLFGDFYSAYIGKFKAEFVKANELLEKSDRLYVQGLREMNPSKAYSPDANSTLRVTYGQVLDYYPRDAVYYNFYTTAEGILEKEDPSNPEFIVPAKLKELIQNKDYGKYGEDGNLVVCFLSNNDITGGNSGSPVINGKGELIGTAFDGNWEAMSGDIAFETKMQRTISVDIRYTLFIVDKYAGASHLIDEMTIVAKRPKQTMSETTKAPKAEEAEASTK